MFTELQSPRLGSRVAIILLRYPRKFGYTSSHYYSLCQRYSSRILLPIARGLVPSKRKSKLPEASRSRSYECAGYFCLKPVQFCMERTILWSVTSTASSRGSTLQYPSLAMSLSSLSHFSKIELIPSDPMYRSAIGPLGLPSNLIISASSR